MGSSSVQSLEWEVDVKVGVGSCRGGTRGRHERKDVKRTQGFSSLLLLVEHTLSLGSWNRVNSLDLIWLFVEVVGVFLHLFHFLKNRSSEFWGKMSKRLIPYIPFSKFIVSVKD